MRREALFVGCRCVNVADTYPLLFYERKGVCVEICICTIQILKFKFGALKIQFESEEPKSLEKETLCNIEIKIQTSNFSHQISVPQKENFKINSIIKGSFT